MGFTVVHGTPQTIWVPVINTDTLYVGQLVRSNNEGVEPLAQASGTADVSRKTAAVGLIRDGSSANNVPFGVVIGTNRRSPLYSTTYKADYITYVAPASASSDDYGMVTEGEWANGEQQAMVKIAILDPSITLRGRIFTDSFGTAPTVNTLTGTPTTLTGTTTANTDEAGIASLSTVYFRTGAASGMYRITDDTSQTVIAWDLPLKTAPVSGDTLVRVNLSALGLSCMQIDAEAMFVDSGATVTSNYFMIDVIRLNLKTAGEEYVDFRFNPYTFNCLDNS